MLNSQSTHRANKNLRVEYLARHLPIFDDFVATIVDFFRLTVEFRRTINNAVADRVMTQVKRCFT